MEKFLHHNYSSLQINRSQFRVLNTQIFDKNTLQNGGFLLYIFAIIYFLIAIFIIFKKFFQNIIEDLIYLIEYKEEFFRPIVYQLLNSLLFILLAFYAVLNGETNIGMGAIISSDCMNLFLVFGLILYKFYQQEGNLDIWLFLRDSMYYLSGLIGLAVIYEYDAITYYAGIIYISYYILFIIVLALNNSIKEKIYTLIGLIDEDDSFNADENLKYKKNRESITVLNESKFINKEDALLKQKLNRNQAIVKFNFKDSNKRDKIDLYLRFQKAVYIVIFALRNKLKALKKARSDYYNQVLNQSKANRESRTLEMQQDPNQDLNNEENIFFQNPGQDNPYVFDKPESFHNQNPSKQQIKRGSSEKYNENNFLLKCQNLQELSQEREGTNQEDNLAMQPQVSDLDNMEMQTSKKKAKSQVNFEEKLPQFSAILPKSSMHYLEEEEDDENFLQLPHSFTEVVIFFFLFPINLFLFLIPNYKQKPTLKRLFQTMTCCLAVICILSYYILQWFRFIAEALRIQQETMGLTFTAFGFNFFFIYYNLKLAKFDKDLDFIQSFLQLGICKIGLGIGFSWFVGALYYNRNIMARKYKSFGICIGIYAGIIFVSIVLVGLQRFMLKKKQSFGLLFLFSVFLFCASFLNELSF